MSYMHTFRLCLSPAQRLGLKRSALPLATVCMAAPPDARAQALARLVDWAAPRLRRHGTEAVSAVAAAVAMDTGAPCHLLLAAAQHFNSCLLYTSPSPRD
eukprot:3247388-Alexandrium_andersonii.AAC.1